MPDPPPRIRRLRRSEWTDEARDVFSALGGGAKVWEEGTDHFVLTTFARYPELTRPFLSFNRHLLYASSLPVRLRQIAILRVAWTWQARYMWASHMRLSLQLGLVEADFEAVKVGAEDPHWSGQEAAVIRGVDQLREGADLDDEAWDALAAHWDDRQMMDFLFTVGAYALLAMVMNSTRIQREADLEELADRLGSPR